MDRNINKSTKNKEQRKQWVKVGMNKLAGPKFSELEQKNVKSS